MNPVFLPAEEQEGVKGASELLCRLVDEKYRVLLDESSDFMCIADREGKFIYVNKRLSESLGYFQKEMLHMHLEDIMTQESLEEFNKRKNEFLKKGKLLIDHFTLNNKSKEKVSGVINVIAFYDNHGQYCGAKMIFTDQTKLLELEELEKSYESMMEDGINTLDHVIIILDKAFKTKWASVSTKKFFGIDKSEIVGKDMRLLLRERQGLFAGSHEEFLKTIASLYETQGVSEGLECVVSPLGARESYYMEHWSHPITQGELKGGRIEIYRDITSRKKSQEALEHYYQKIHSIMEHAVEGIVELRADNKIEFVNSSFLAMLGVTREEMFGRSLEDFVLPEQRIRLASIKLIRQAREVTFLKKDGTYVYTLMSSIPLVFGTHAPHALCFICDITQTKIASTKLRDSNLSLRALNDALLDLSLRDVRTGVYNYRYLVERLAEELKRAERYLRPFSLIMIDIDFFKVINDTYGHNFGDLVLKGFTEFLRGCVREMDVIVRAGGEEFVVFLSDADAFGALTVARKIVKSFKKASFGDGERRVNISVSLGIISYPEAGISGAVELLEAVDAAMYRSKEKGRNRITVFKKTNKRDLIYKIKDNDWASFDQLKERLKNLNDRNEESIMESLKPIVREVERRTGYDSEAIELILRNVETLGESFGLLKRKIRDLKRASMLRRIGLLSIPASVLSKKKILTKNEARLLKEYPARSFDIIRDLSFLLPAGEDILYHQERFDGKGYPEGLKGGQIPLGARIISVVETYVALISSRPYRRKALAKKNALKIIKKESGKQFDPEVVKRFIKQIES